MSTTKSTTTQPVCKVPGCKHGASVLSKKGDYVTYMKTCSRHTYKDLPEEKEKLDTFWPPADKDN
jgi:hypothetical protein